MTIVFYPKSAYPNMKAIIDDATARYGCIDVDWNFRGNQAIEVHEHTARMHVGHFVKSKEVLIAYKRRHFPHLSVVTVDAPAYRGPGIVSHAQGDAPPDLLPVQLENDNIHWYSVADVRPNPFRPIWPRWILRLLMKNMLAMAQAKHHHTPAGTLIFARGPVRRLP